MRVLVVDDHPLFREAVGNSIRQAVADAEIIEAATIDEALDVLSCGGIELTLFDLSLPGTTGLSGLLRLRKAFPGSPIVVISCHKDSLIVASALFLGVSGYIHKSTSKKELVRAIGEVLRGSIYLPNCYRHNAEPDRSKDSLEEFLKRLHDLTPQQLRVLELIHRGLQNKQIAYELRICETTVKVHVSEILRKLDIANRTKAIVEMSKIDFANLAGDSPGMRVQESV
ncbi:MULTISPECIES: response regulator transcription factor [unclassified Bradyrhizobium]|uniref:response regulator n=1 Tax=unclassified Bradyrhizobium TaxID=2631580 RepID=UPI000408B032|nr:MULTISPECIES: response regulator transcription factor [unclassified Bradyrhizobium]MCP3467872.1 response regulator transcription factor [Bradyrhizobium sp. CCGUVB23]